MPSVRSVTSSCRAFAPPFPLPGNTTSPTRPSGSPGTGCRPGTSNAFPGETPPAGSSALVEFQRAKISLNSFSSRIASRTLWAASAAADVSRTLRLRAIDVSCVVVNAAITIPKTETVTRISSSEKPLRGPLARRAPGPFLPFPKFLLRSRTNLELGPNHRLAGGCRWSRSGFRGRAGNETARQGIRGGWFDCDAWKEGASSSGRVVSLPAEHLHAAALPFLLPRFLRPRPFLRRWSRARAAAGRRSARLRVRTLRGLVGGALRRLGDELRVRGDARRRAG